jgi:hypothetical protein
LAEQSEKVVAALIIDAVKKYEENRQEAVFFLEALEKNISSQPPQRSHAETRDGEGKKFDSYHEALDVVVERLEPFVSLLARPGQEREITIVSEFLGYAASYHAKKMMGVELSQVGWNSFASSVEYRIVGKLGENPKRSGANILPGGGVEFVSYSTQYRSYLTKIDTVVDESFTPAKANVWPVLDGLGVSSRRLSETQAKDLEKNFNWCVGFCMREVVPDVLSSFG